MIVFNYRKEKSTITENIFRPIASVKFKSKENAWIKLRLYIDSGADITIIPLSFGRLLGLELKKEDIKQLTGVGGTSIPVVITEVEIKINDIVFPINIAWALEEDIPPLLGRTGVFDKFTITFDQNKKIIIFDSN
ncbi:MAG: aspartyl protease family protein [Methanosarcinales archaeon]|jgi:Aspartyl protease|nr:aspartyl protease family protein [Methanosarcinales archaeon]MCD4808694.1 aspartyl protease family protein [Methanosarcinales archaeon]MCD4816619.1 aspartyl protease family protein [Methanosarcinales archaeon]